jgi:membrane protein required for colicin V production
MNYLDLIIAIPLVWGFIRGLSKGFIIEIASLIALIAGIWAGIHFSDLLSTFLLNKLGWSATYVPIISFLIIFIAIVIGVFIIAKVLEKFVNLLALGLINKLAGGIFGALKFAVILSVLIIILNKFDSKSTVINQTTKDGSMLYYPTANLVPMVIPKLKVIKTEMKDLTKTPTEKEIKK